MTKQIRTYKELLEEKQRLQSLLKVQKEMVNQDFRALGESLEPIRSAVSVAGKLFTRDDSNILLNIGMGTLIDLFIKKLLLSKSGWLTRTLIPFLLKNYSSHLNGNSLMKKLFSWIGKKDLNGQEKAGAHEREQEEEEEEDD